MWLVVVTAVNNGTQRRHLLNHGAGVSLSKRSGCQFRYIHIGTNVQDTSGLTGKVNTGKASKIEDILILHEFFRAHRVCQLHHYIVAGISDCGF